MLAIWQLYRGGGFGGGSLPDPGGSQQQSAVMMEAMRWMDSCYGEFTKDDD